jgi:flagellar biosynthesis protein FlhF
MKVKRYIADNMQEAMTKVKIELGSDAFILSSKKVRPKKGILSIFMKPVLEVVAAVDELPREKQQKAMENNKIASEREEKVQKLETKVVDMEKLLSQIYDKVNQVQAATSPVENGKQTFFDKFKKNLIDNDVAQELAEKVIEDAKLKCTKPDNMTEVASVIYSTIAGIMGSSKPIVLNENKSPKVAVFVGPTGVGKTTTLAKLAGNFALLQGKKVALLTTDTYRISAVDQLKTYADIMGIPVSILYSPEDVKTTMELYSDKDLILVDTAGRSHKDETQFDEISNILSKFSNPEVYLVLSSVTNLRTLKEISKSYSFIEKSKLVITKIDESATPAMILNSRLLIDMPLAYITNGQSVPDDIEVADIDRIIKNLMGSIANEGSSR